MCLPKTRTVHPFVRQTINIDRVVDMLFGRMSCYAAKSQERHKMWSDKTFTLNDSLMTPYWRDTAKRERDREGFPQDIYHSFQLISSARLDISSIESVRVWISLTYILSQSTTRRPEMEESTSCQCGICFLVFDSLILPQQLFPPNIVILKRIIKGLLYDFLRLLFSLGCRRRHSSCLLFTLVCFLSFFACSWQRSFCFSWGCFFTLLWLHCLLHLSNKTAFILSLL